MTADKFRAMALEIPGSVESSHMRHPDFRFGGKVFASLGYPDEEHGMVKLSPEQQREFLNQAPGMFAPAAGAWGRGGATVVHLRSGKAGLLRAALKAAAETVASKTKGKPAASPRG